MHKLITISTDLKDAFATSQLRVVMINLGFDGRVVENHDVMAFSIIEGAYGIWQLIKHYPLDSIHLGIVDPGVGSERAGLVIQTTNHWFVGPDNGLLYPAASEDKIVAVWKINEEFFGQISNTFHGRDVFIKVAVLLAQGRLPESFGCEKTSKVEKFVFKPDQIVHIDHYGNIKYWGDNTFGIPVVKTFSDVPEGEALILKGSSNISELAVNLGNAADKFGLKLGQTIISL